MQGFNYKKAVQLLNYFAKHEGGSINKLKALKLTWLADRLHLRKYGRPIVHDVYFAMKLGPVPSNTKDLIEASEFLSEEELEYRNQFLVIVDTKQREFKSIANVDPNVFSQTDRECIKTILAQFANINPFELSEVSHNFPEWQKFENILLKGPSSRYPMEYEDFFENPQSGNHSVFEEDEELLDMAKEEYLEQKNTAQLL